MASGAWHYQKAEGLLVNAWAHVGGVDGDGTFLHPANVRLALVTAAQAHATLALAAATAMTGLDQIAQNGEDFYDAEEDAARNWAKAVLPR